MRIEKYGAGGEKLSQAQMQLFELEPVVSEMIEQAESEHAPVHRSTKKSVKHPGRQELPANLPRVERILPCALDQRLCERCGRKMVVIGYEERSRLDVEPVCLLCVGQVGQSWSELVSVGQSLRSLSSRPRDFRLHSYVKPTSWGRSLRSSTDGR